VERTAGDEIRTGFFERHIPLDHVHDIETIKQILNEIFWNHASTTLSSRSTPPFFEIKTQGCRAAWFDQKLFR
jgi:hypothetical protein